MSAKRRGQDEHQEELRERVRQSLARVDHLAASYRRLDFWLIVLSIVLGTLATVLAGGTAAAGQRMADALNGWRTVCAVVAIFTAIGTVAGTIHKTYQVTDRLARALACKAKLQALELSLSISEPDISQATYAYQQLLTEYADCLG